jgi:hypothetical protein
MTTEHTDNHDPGVLEQIGQAGEEFARQVAHDAGTFARRIQRHAGDFARSVGRERWRTQRHRRHVHHRHAAAPEVRRLFDDVRTIVTDVFDGLDVLLGRILPAAETAPEAAWERIVSNCSVTCLTCGRTIRAGEEIEVRRTTDRIDFRCLTCPAPAAAPEPPAAPGGTTSEPDAPEPSNK